MSDHVWWIIIPIPSVTKPSLKDVCLAIHPSFCRRGGKWKGGRLPLPVPVVFIAGERLLGLGRDVGSTPRAEHPPLPAHVAPLPPGETAPRRVLSTLPVRTPARTRGTDPASGATQPAWLTSGGTTSTNPEHLWEWWRGTSSPAF